MSREFIIKFTVKQDLTAEQAKELVRKFREVLDPESKCGLDRGITIFDGQPNEVTIHPSDLWTAFT